MFAETRLLNEYLRDRYPDAVTLVKPRLGAFPAGLIRDTTDDAERRFASNFRRWADAIVIEDEQLIVIEAVMWDPGRKVGQIQAYIKLVPHTPELEEYHGLPIVGEIVTAQHDPLAQEVIEDAGFRYVHYEPEWMEEWLSLYPARKRRPAFTGRPGDRLEGEGPEPSTPGS